MEKTRPELRPAPPTQPGSRWGLYLVLCGEKPLAGGMGFDLSGVREIVFGRGGPLGASALGDARARIEVPDPTMSSDHARLVLDDAGGVVVEDLGSRNGTRLLGHAVKRNAVQGGDWFVLGRTAFMVKPVAGRVPSSPFATGGSRLVTFEPELAHLYQTAIDLARSKVPILLLGETGTGKDVLAQEIHAASGRAGRMVAVNCAALPETLVESELFGSRKGAFSDAREDRAGLIRTADGGTLLLDEVGDLPLASQAKLLRVLQDGQVLALGASTPVQVDLRVVSAAQRGLDELVREGAFRADLLGRLAGFSITVPPLRDRLVDLGILTAVMLKRLAGAEADAYRITADALCALLTRRWPLNIRALEKTLEAAVELARGGREIAVEHLGIEANLAKTEELAPEAIEGELRRLLSLRQGNVSAVARDLGKARMQIHRWMAQFGIDPAQFRPSG